ncbi:nuclear transport factor 2 family protein [Fibrella aquatica]|uniref:nuclear transport factor 2 family protein n=1 Tax=Fibrella aquatica TaxID=3242487 RepID=UPI0035217C61
MPLRSVTLVCLLLSGLASAAQTPFHDALINSDKQRFAAQIKKDSVALTRLLSDKLVYSHSNGVIETKQQFIHSLMTGRWNYQSIDTDSVKVHFITTSLAIVTGRARVVLLVNGKSTPVYMAYTDVWNLQTTRPVKGLSAGRWQLISWAATRLPPP